MIADFRHTSLQVIGRAAPLSRIDVTLQTVLLQDIARSWWWAVHASMSLKQILQGS